MPRYRFPGRTTTIPAYCAPKVCKPLIEIKVCPPQPYIRDNACKPNIYDRAIIRVLSPDNGCGKKQCHLEQVKPRFVLETFHKSLILCPLNLHRFCGYDFKDGEIVAVEAEDMLCPPSQETICCVPGAISVKLFNIKRTWKLEIRHLQGIVQAAVDNNDIPYHIITEVTDLSQGDPTFAMTENVLLTSPIVIYYELVNIMGQVDAEATMVSLEGKTISATYVDYGTETPDRLGLPIVVTDYKVLN
jgi:hypothetical protein